MLLRITMRIALASMFFLSGNGSVYATSMEIAYVDPCGALGVGCTNPTQEVPPAMDTSAPSGGRRNPDQQQGEIGIPSLPPQATNAPIEQPKVQIPNPQPSTTKPPVIYLPEATIQSSPSSPRSLVRPHSAAPLPQTGLPAWVTLFFGIGIALFISLPYIRSIRRIGDV